MAGELVERLRRRAEAMFALSDVSRNTSAAWRIEVKACLAKGSTDGITAADRIEALERENAILRAERDEARKATIADAAAICDGQAKYFRDLSNNPACLTDIRWNSRSEARHTMQSYAERHESDAAAIRNMGGGE